MNKKKDYSYPDRGDAITDALISSESDKDYWAASEENVLGYAIAAMNALRHGRGGARKCAEAPGRDGTQNCAEASPAPAAPGREATLSSQAAAGRGLRMLDLGCGMGRLLPVFSPLVGSLDGLEPDAERCACAAEAAKELPNVTVRRGDCFSAAGPYDAVLCSHVFQHIPRKTTEGIFACVSGLLVRGGLFIVTTTHTDRDADGFTQEVFEDGKRRTSPITPEQFDGGGSAGALPVRYFAVATVEALASRHGFKTVGKYGYHFSADAGEATGGGGRRAGGFSVADDIAMNAAADLSRARDMLYIFEKI